MKGYTIAMITRDIQQLFSRFPHYGDEISEHYRRNFLLLVFDSAFFTFSTSLLSQDTVLPAFISQFSSSPILIGLIPAIFYLGYFLPQLISSYLTQTRTRRKGMILGIAIAERVGILMIALTAQSVFKLPNTIILVMFFISYLLFTSTLGMIIPAYSDFTSKAIYRDRGLYYGILQAIGGFIGFSASWIATNILSKYHFPVNFQYIFWLCFAFSFVSPFIISQLKEVKFPIPPNRFSIPDFLKKIPATMQKFPNLWIYIFSRHLFGFAMMGNSFFILYALTRFNLESGSVGIFTMVILLSQSISGVVWGQVGDRFGYQKVLSISSLLLVAEGATALLSRNPLGFYVIAGMMGCVYSAIHICHANLIFVLAPPEETSLFIGLSNTLIAPILIIAPILGGKIIDSFGHPNLFITITITGALAFILATFVFHEPRDD